MTAFRVTARCKTSGHLFQGTRFNHQNTGDFARYCEEIEAVELTPANCNSDEERHCVALAIRLSTQETKP